MTCLLPLLLCILSVSAVFFACRLYPYSISIVDQRTAQSSQTSAKVVQEVKSSVEKVVSAEIKRVVPPGKYVNS